MYGSCIFCSAALGSNESIERFPVGRSLAFDAAKGRLWAVCSKCARWNLAPIEERWEAIEEAERLFRDSRLRAQSENVGVAKLLDGTRLVRVGQALPRELAAWRYGRGLMRRHQVRHRWRMTLDTLGFWLPGADRLVAWMAEAMRSGPDRARLREQWVPASLSPTGAPLVLPRPVLEGTRFSEAGDGTLLVRVPLPGTGAARAFAEFRGQAARTVLARAMPILNHDGADSWEMKVAVGLVLQAPSAEAYIRTLAQRGGLLGGPLAPPERLTGAALRALEMALNEETERRALDGELAMLEAMWREAEEIAAIADRLPDVPAPQPPRLVKG
jgi:hypothetical protein